MAQPTRAGAGTLRLADQRAVEIQASRPASNAFRHSDLPLLNSSLDAALSLRADYASDGRRHRGRRSRSLGCEVGCGAVNPILEVPRQLLRRPTFLPVRNSTETKVSSEKRESLKLTRPRHPPARVAGTGIGAPPQSCDPLANRMSSTRRLVAKPQSFG